MKIHMPHLSLLTALLAMLAMSLDTVLADPPAKGAPTVQKVVPAARPAATLGKDSSPAIRTLPAAVLKTQGPVAGPSASGSIQSAVLANCATGFNKTGEHKDLQGALYDFECTTPVITCPNNPVYPNSSLDVEIINTNPEQSAKRIRYTCTYYPAIP